MILSKSKEDRAKALEKIPPNVKHLLVKATPVKIEIAKVEVDNTEENKANEDWVPPWKMKTNLREGV